MAQDSTERADMEEILSSILRNSPCSLRQALEQALRFEHWPTCGYTEDLIEAWDNAKEANGLSALESAGGGS